MHTLFTFIAVASAAVGTGCCLLTRHVHWPAAVSMGLVLVGMVDTMVWGGLLLPALAWALGFALVAAGLMVSRRPRYHPMAGHTAAMAALTAVAAIAVMHAPSTADGRSPAHHGSSSGESGAGQLFAIAALAGIVAVAYLVVVAVRRRGRERVENACSALSTLAMTAMVPL